MKKRRIFALLSLYSLAMLSILLFTVWILSNTKQNQTVFSSPNQTEHIYVYVTETIEQTSPQENETNTTEVNEGWVVKEYEGRIGIFNREGVLLYVLDTYVKTLPAADKRLLGEGIVIETQAELMSLIEDYTA